MGRHILIVLLGLVLSHLMMVTSGYIVYRIGLSTGWSDPQLGALLRYLIDPLIAVIVGSVVGALAKKRAGLLGALSLLPLVTFIPLFKRLDFLHETVLIFLSCLYLLLGASVAQLAFRMRARTKPVS
jgi:chromate transport protein ChrA